MEINSNNLIDTSIIKNSKNFENIKTENLEDKELRKVSDDFESFFLSQILDISLKTTKVAGEGAGSDIIKGMYTQNIAQSSTGTLGISNMLYEFLTEKNK